MTPILDRIRASGGEVIRDKWRLTIRRGRLTDAALAWLREPRRKAALMAEVWPDADEFQERAAIREFDGGQTREDAERAAYAEVMRKVDTFADCSKSERAGGCYQHRSGPNQDEPALEVRGG